MRDLDGPWDAGWDRVEAVAVGGDIGSGPGLARETAVGDEDLVAEVGGAATVLGSVGWAEGDVAAKGGGGGDSEGWGVGIGGEELLDKGWGKSVLR